MLGYSDADNCLQGEPVPGPLPLGVAVIDSSVRLYGLVFPHVAHKHRLQMLEHFGECIKQAKASRQQAIQINIFTAVLYALKVKHLLLSSAPYYRFCFGHSLVLLHFVLSLHVGPEPGTQVGSMAQWVVEHCCLNGALSLSCARPAADG